MNATVGLQPWLPWPLRRWAWWTVPVRAERLAALRIGLAAVLLLDVLFSYLPHAADSYGRDGLGAAELQSIDREGGGAPWPVLRRGKGQWSLLKGVEDGRTVRLAVVAWAVAAGCLLVGLASRLSAAAAWALALSVDNLEPAFTNAGDTVRVVALFYLMLSPCGAVWSVDAWWRRRPGPVLVHPWPLRLLFVQMALIYFCNGVHKAVGYHWPRGQSLYYVLGDWTLTRWSYAQVPVPYFLTRLLSWLVLGWEVSFPVLVLWRRSRVVALAFGAAFHVGILASLELGGFAPYMLCLYLPLLPWERWASGDREQGRALDGEKVGVGHGDGGGVVAGVEVDRGVEAQRGVAGGGQAEQAAERRDAAGL
jgi:hypothetical protein